MYTALFLLPLKYNGRSALPISSITSCNDHHCCQQPGRSPVDAALLLNLLEADNLVLLLSGPGCNYIERISRQRFKELPSEQCSA
jgi:hypothetical protein